MSVAARQALLAAVLDDPAVEARVREDAHAVAAEWNVDLDFVEQLAALEPRRIRSFRISRRVKADRRRP